VVLIAQAALKSAADDRFLTTRTLQSSAAPASADMPGMMAAMSTLWAGLADDLAQLIAEEPVALPREQG
jgi:ABC-type transport auxiliary lipoprotein component